MNESKCPCQTPPFDYKDLPRRRIGVDTTEGRYADVSIEQCTRCGQRWLRYFFENESFSRSGRWYRGPISEETAQQVTPDNATEILQQIGWYFRGGSYFDSTGSRVDRPLDTTHL